MEPGQSGQLNDFSSGDVGTLTNWCITFTYGSGYTLFMDVFPAGFTSSVQNPGTVSPTVTTTYTLTTTSTGTVVQARTRLPSLLIYLRQLPWVQILLFAAVLLQQTCLNTATTGSPNQYSIVWTGTSSRTGIRERYKTPHCRAARFSITVPAAAAAGVYTGNLTVTNSAGGCAGTSVSFTVSINDISAGAIAADQAICSTGDPAALTSPTNASGPGTITYQWQSNTTGCGDAFTDIPGATGSTYDPPVTSTTTYFRRVATSTLNGVACTANSNCVTVSINTVTPGTIASDQTVCGAGDPAAFTQTPATGEERSLINGKAAQQIVLPVSTILQGATGTTYDPPSGLAITTYYRRVATSSIGNCTATSNCITVTVNIPSAGVVAGDQAYVPEAILRHLQ
jgi:hypothetical protein